MKTKLITIGLALALIAILGGAYLLTSTGVTPLGASIKYDPNTITMDTTAPPIWYAYVRSANASPYDFPARYINGSTILFEYTLPALPGVGYIYKGAWVAEFDGPAFLGIVLSKIGHMGIPHQANPNNSVKYWFTITGNLIDSQGGTPFVGQGWIAVSFPGGVPPPPPPPP